MSFPDSLARILTTASLDLALSCLIIGLFLFYRKIRSLPAHTEVDQQAPKLPHFNESEYSFIELLKLVYQIPITNLESIVGQLGALFLSLNLYIFYLFSLFLVFGFVLTLEFNYGSADLKEEDLGTLGIAHVLNDNSILYLSLSILILFSIFAYALCVLVYRAGTSSTKIDRTPEQQSVIISNLPQIDPNSLNSKLDDWFKKKYPDLVLSIDVIPDWKNAYAYYKEYKKNLETLKFYQNELDKTGERPIYKKYFLFKMDAITLYATKVKDLAVRIDFERSHRTNSAGVAFVTFTCPNIMKEFLQSFQGEEDSLESHKWSVSQAYAPSDILWENLPFTLASETEQKVITSIFLVVCFVLLIPTTSTVVSDLMGKNPGFFQSLTLTYSSTLLLFIYQQLVLPHFVKFVIKKEEHTNKVSKRASGFSKYLKYLFFYVFLYPLLGLQVLEFFNLIFANPGDWSLTFAYSLTASGEFFTLFMVHQLFIKNSLDLLNFNRYFVVKFRTMAASTHNEQLLAYKADAFKYDREYALLLNNFLVTISFSVVYPLIIIPGALFFGVRYLVNKHNLLCFYHGRKDISIKEILMTIENRVVLYVFCMQLLTGFVFALSEHPPFYGVSVLLTCLSIGLLVVFEVVIRYLKYEREPSEHEKIKLLGQVEKNCYRHPLEDIQLSLS